MTGRWEWRPEPYPDPPSVDEDVAKLRLQLSHLSLFDLENKGIVSWDRGQNVVKKGPQFDNYANSDFTNEE